uniref:Uncharacterized protein n=1 Tax=Anguilla anguilla TaxID=7936 RepID=A0A0E9UQD8_ANGAN
MAALLRHASTVEREIYASVSLLKLQSIHRSHSLGSFRQIHFYFL